MVRFFTFVKKEKERSLGCFWGLVEPETGTNKRKLSTGALFYAVAGWGGGIKSGEQHRLSRLVRKTCSGGGLKLNSVESCSRKKDNRQDLQDFG